MHLVLTRAGHRFAFDIGGDINPTPQITLPPQPNRFWIFDRPLTTVFLSPKIFIYSLW